MAVASIPKSPLIKVRRSKVHGMGVFAVKPIKKGTRIIEYLGERVSHAEADRRYEDKADSDNHTFLFTVDRKTVIDAGVGGNDARYFNHSCDPSCESVIEDKRVFIEAIRDIQPGEELSYDYQISREADDPPDIDEVFACRCGYAKCRGTMLWPPKRPKKKSKGKSAPISGRRRPAERKSTKKSKRKSGAVAKQKRSARAA